MVTLAVPPPTRLETESEDLARHGERPTGVILGVGLQLGAALLAASGVARPVALGFPVVAVLVGFGLLRRRRGSEYLEFVLCLWLFTPELRRIVDWKSGWDPLSPVMLAAPVVSLMSLPAALTGARKVHRSVVGTFALMLTAIAYGFFVGVVKVGVAPSLGGLLNWLAPLSLGCYVAFAGPDRAAARRTLERVAVWGALVLGAYGLVQFFVLPAWDVFWMENAPLRSLGRAEPREVRIFSTLNSPGPLATVLGCLLMLVPASRSFLRLPAVVLGLASFGLALVRSAWFGFVVALVLFISRSRAHGLRAALVVAGAIVLVVSVGGPVQQAVSERLTQTVSSGQEDQSLGQRLEAYTTLLPAVARDVVGQGLGSTGTATKLSNSARELGSSGQIDGAGLEVLFAFGIGVGTAVLVSIVSAALAVLRQSRRRGQLDKAMAGALLGLLVQLFFGNPLVSVSGVFFWLLLGLSARADGGMTPEVPVDTGVGIAAQAGAIGPSEGRTPARPSASTYSSR